MEAQQTPKFTQIFTELFEFQQERVVQVTALKKYRNVQNVSTPASNRQVKNNTGGFVFEVSDQSRLERFLILGTDGGTYYVNEEDLTQQNVSWLEGLIRRDWALVLNTVSDVSINGRAYRNSAAIFVLALVLNVGSDEAKAKVVELTPIIARTATHVYELATYIKNLGGWGRSKRRAVAQWFTSKTPDQLAYQAVKYRQRDGWTLKDLMRLSHPVGVGINAGNFILGKPVTWADGPIPEIFDGFEAMQNASSVSAVVAILDNYKNLPWETIPTEFLKSPEVWKKLYYNNQLNGQALIRNIVRLQKNGAFEDASFVNDVAARLSDPDMILRTKLHPMNFLNASIVYSEGKVERDVYNLTRNKSWSTNQTIYDALEAGFYASFKNVVPSGKKILVGLDVSGSMSWNVAVGSDLSAAMAGAAMAMIFAKVEPETLVYGFSDSFRDLKISPDMTFSQIKVRTSAMNFGATNMSLPMEFAQKNQTGTETFVVITDNEVNRGNHPSQTLKKYRQVTGLDARMAVMGMTVTNFSIADPLDRGMLDVVGFDSNAPKVVSDFSGGKF